MIIESGGRKSYSAIVDKNGKLLVNADSESRIAQASVKGLSYSLYSDFIPLTTLTAFSGIIWVKNSSTLPFVVERIRTCGTTLAQWYLYKNVTTGTLVSAGVAKIPANLNLGVSLSFAGTVNAGADLRTITDGMLITQMICEPGHCYVELGGSLIIPQNTTIALSCKPSAGGTFCSFIHGFFSEDLEE